MDLETLVHAQLSIGALSRATGIPVETLRTWESRYGYPVAIRKPSGHRSYPVSVVARLQRIATALAHGHRAGDVVPASDTALAALLEGTGIREARPRPTRTEPALPSTTLLAAMVAFDGEAINAELLAAWGRLGPVGFLRERVAPALTAVGEGWATGRFEVRHERFFSERLDDLLRSLRQPLVERAQGPVMVAATLAGERHGLGLQMAMLLFAVAGWRVCGMGTDVPPDEVAILAQEVRARAVAVSVSSAHGSPAMGQQVGRLREVLPRHVALVVGGQGAPGGQPGVETVSDIDGLDRWAHRSLAGN